MKKFLNAQNKYQHVKTLKARSKKNLLFLNVVVFSFSPPQLHAIPLSTFLSALFNSFSTVEISKVFKLEATQLNTAGVEE